MILKSKYLLSVLYRISFPSPRLTYHSPEEKDHNSDFSILEPLSSGDKG